MKTFTLENWRENFPQNALNQSEDYIDSVEKLTFHNTSINAHLKKSSHFTVSMTLENDEITYMYCTCSKKGFCKHEAAVLAYIEKNRLVEREKDFKALMQSVGADLFREYVRELFNNNPQIKYDFINKFKKEAKIDLKPYSDKLEMIISKSRGKDYIDFGYYDIDVLASGIEDFLICEVWDLMDICQ